MSRKTFHADTPSRPGRSYLRGSSTPIMCLCYHGPELHEAELSGPIPCTACACPNYRPCKAGDPAVFRCLPDGQSAARQAGGDDDAA